MENKDKGWYVLIYVFVMLVFWGSFIYLEKLEEDMKPEMNTYEFYSDKFEKGESYWPKNNLSDWTNVCYSYFKDPFYNSDYSLISDEDRPAICKFAEQKDIAPVEIRRAAEQIGCSNHKLKKEACNKNFLLNQLNSNLPEIKEREVRYRNIHFKLSMKIYIKIIAFFMVLLILLYYAAKVFYHFSEKRDELAKELSKSEPFKEYRSKIEKQIEDEENKAKQMEDKEKTISELEHDIKVGDLVKKKVTIEKQIEKIKGEDKKEIKAREREENLADELETIEFQIKKGRKLDDLYNENYVRISKEYGHDKTRMDKELRRLEQIFNQVKFKM